MKSGLPTVGVLTATVAGSLLLGACGHDACCEPPAVASVTVTPATDTVVVTDTMRLTATAKDAAGHVLSGRVVTWASSSPAVATISATGLVTGVAENGVAATITATSEGVSGSAAITVSPGLPIVAAPLTTGADHACGLSAAGAAYCWGWNSSGQLGNGSTATSAVPVAVFGSLRFSLVTTGTFGHTCGLTAVGAAYCWGSNYFGQLGTGSNTNSATPVVVSGGLRFITLASGTDHTCGLTRAGAAYCWGEGSWGQLGNGSTTNRNGPVPVSGGLTFSVLVAGGYGTCALTNIGAAYCWGENLAGQLGNGSTTGPDLCNGRACGATPVQVSGGVTFAALARGGGYHKCGLTFFGVTYCWGRNSNGQLGDSSTTNRLAPAPVSGGLSFSVIATGDDFTCGLTNAGAAYCWGYNRFGELGNGSASGPDLCTGNPCSVAPVAVVWNGPTPIGNTPRRQKAVTLVTPP